MNILKNTLTFFIISILLTACLASDDISTENKIGDTKEGRAQILAFIQPGVTTLNELKSKFGKPVAVQQVDTKTRQANYAGYFSSNGYAGVRFHVDTLVISSATAYGFNKQTEQTYVEATKP